MREPFGVSKSPEEEELEEKLRTLAQLDEQLTQEEVESATLRVELREFEQLYLRTVGVKYAELDEVHARIAELLLAREPANPVARRHAADAREQAQASSRATEWWLDLEEPSRKSRPLDELRRLYREVAKRVHPDLTIDPDEREYRQTLMAEANQAYAAGDLTRLREVLERAHHGPEMVKGEDIIARLVRTIRRIARVRKGIAAIRHEIAEMRATDLFELRQKVLDAERSDRDLLEEMTFHLDVQIGEAKERLRSLVKEPQFHDV